MTDVPSRTSSDPLPEDPSDLLQRVRRAEAHVEFLESAQKSQESLASRLEEALRALDEARTQLARQRPESAAARRLRSFAARARGRIGRAPKGDGLAAVPPSIDPWSGTDLLIDDTGYKEWIERYDTLDSRTRTALLARVDALADPPLVSIVFPVYDAPADYLGQAIESVLAQLYTNWELCVSDDCSTKPGVAEVLDHYAKIDERIHVTYRTQNGHISASSNTALAMAQGRWVCLMDHDDLLAEHALAVAVLALDSTPDAGILYSDEDHVTEDGARRSPYFKPDFDPLLILGQNYFSHLCMIRAELARKVGGFREGVEGSQDWDLVLRVLEEIRPDQVVHVPHVLYHWRTHPESTASSVSAKPYVVEASRRVVQEHLDRVGVPATAATIRGSSFNRIRWAPSSNPPTVSIVILPRTGKRFCRAIDSIRVRTSYPKFEILVLDDGAFRPPMRQYLRDHADTLTVIEDNRDLSDSAQRNRVAAEAGGEILCFVHDDVEVLTETWLEEMVGALSYPGVGAVGAKLLYPDFTIQHAGIVLGIGGTIGYTHRLHFDTISPGHFGRLMLAQCPSAVSWACMAVRREAFDSVGGFDEDHFTSMFGDVDFCLRLRRAGWRTAWSPHAELIHYENPEETRGADGENAVRFDRDIRMLHSAWGAWVENDPAYNPNLSLAHESYPLAWPPRKTLL